MVLALIQRQVRSSARCRGIHREASRQQSASRKDLPTACGEQYAAADAMLSVMYKSKFMLSCGVTLQRAAAGLLCFLLPKGHAVDPRPQCQEAR